MGKIISTVLILAAFAKVMALAAEPAATISPVLLEKFDARLFEQTGRPSLKYRLFKPRPYHSQTNYPLVVFLHGAAGLGDDNIRQFRGGNEVPPLALTTDEVQAAHPCFVMAPQCPRGAGWASLNDQPGDRFKMTLGAIESLKREFNLDPERFYIVGVSMGGGGVWDAVARFPKMFAAAIPICGVGDPAIAPKIVRVPIWCFHGAADTTVSVEYARKMITALRKAGGEPRYTEYPGVGHDSYRNAFQDPELVKWLFAQKRKP